MAELARRGGNSIRDRSTASDADGAPLGGDAFVAGLERQTGRMLRVRSQGRPTKRSRLDAGQAWSFNR